MLIIMFMAIARMADAIRGQAMHLLHASVTMTPVHMLFDFRMFVFRVVISMCLLAILDSQMSMTWIPRFLIDVMNEIVLGH